MTSERRDNIVEAARELFLHYGFQKVTLSDIAKAVGVSRPTVYQEFANKDEVFTAIIDQWQIDALGRIKEVFKLEKGVDDLLGRALEIWVVEPFRMLNESPRAAEFSDSSFDFAKDTLEWGMAAFEKLLVQVLGDRELSGGVSAVEAARLISVSAKGFKHQAKDLKELRSLLGSLIRMVLGSFAGR